MQTLSDTLTLTPVEQRLARYLALQRFTNNRKGGVVDQQKSHQPAEEMELDSVGAELAFCRMFNIYPDLTTEVRSGGPDCVLAGRTLDVKQTHHRHGHLIASKRKAEAPSDLYALVIGVFPTYRYVGMTTAALLFAVEYVEGTGPVGSPFALPQYDLTYVPPPHEKA
jgi:hypothetical protein